MLAAVFIALTFFFCFEMVVEIVGRGLTVELPSKVGNVVLREADRC